MRPQASFLLRVPYLALTSYVPLSAPPSPQVSALPPSFPPLPHTKVPLSQWTPPPHHQLIPWSQAAAGKLLGRVVGQTPTGWEGVAHAQLLSLGEGPAAPICLTPNIGLSSHREEPQQGSRRQAEWR